MKSDDEPMRLAEACEKLLGGRLTVAALRREAKRGNLTLIKIANKYFVTKKAIDEMMRICEVDPFLPPPPIDLRAIDLSDEASQRAALEYVMAEIRVSRARTAGRG